MEQDLKRLSNWVEQEVEVVGSHNRLAAKLGLSYQALLKWKAGNLKHLNDKSIRAIANYRGESEEATRRWLGGENENAEANYALLQAVKTAPLSIVMQILEISARRAADALSEQQRSAISTIQNISNVNHNGCSKDVGDIVMFDRIGKGAGAIGRLLRAEMRAANLDPLIESDFAEFARWFPFDEPDLKTLKGIALGVVPFVDEDMIGIVANSLSAFSKKDYTTDYLREINDDDDDHSNGYVANGNGSNGNGTKVS